VKNSRLPYIYLTVVIIGLTYLFRLLQIQVLDDKYALIAERISLRKQVIYPQRGLIFDRNQKLLVYNDPVYDLMVSVPISLQTIDTLAFCELLEIDKNTFDKLLAKSKKQSYQGKSLFKKNISNTTYAHIQERMYEFQGFFFEIRQDRNYKYNSSAHLLGYLGEVGESDLMTQRDSFYSQGDFIGKKGVEKIYEKELRGAKGEYFFYVDRSGVNKGVYKNGALNVEPVDGKNLHLTIDVDLQQYGEQLLDNKMGSIVAIEPQTGEILSLISSPFYNPANFNIQNRGKYYKRAIDDPTKPIFNRAVSAPYPPGSTFKPLMALVGLEDNAIESHTHFNCSGQYKLGTQIIKCHYHPSNTSLKESIASSCNTYYCNIFKKMMQSQKYSSTEEAYVSWTSYLNSFGLGNELGIDISGEFKGWVKDADYYNKMHGKNSWNYASIISLSFGQGELGLTPIQIANVAATIANKGYFYTPHVVKQIEGLDQIPKKYLTKHVTHVSPEHFLPVIEGMKEVTISGTASHLAFDHIEIAGKTGTVQNPHGKNHSVYMSFAPVNDPKIAIAVIVEESGYGASWAAPIAHLMIEKYLMIDSENHTTKPKLEEKMINANLIPEKYRIMMDESLYGK
jgi:penicillin-binding protein 2